MSLVTHLHPCGVQPVGDVTHGHVHWQDDGLAVVVQARGGTLWPWGKYSMRQQLRPETLDICKLPSCRVGPPTPWSPVDSATQPEGSGKEKASQAGPPLFSLTPFTCLPSDWFLLPHSLALTLVWSSSSSAQTPFQGSPHPEQNTAPFAGHSVPPAVWSISSLTNHLHSLVGSTGLNYTWFSIWVPQFSSSVLLLLFIPSPEMSPNLPSHNQILSIIQGPVQFF